MLFGKICNNNYKISRYITKSEIAYILISLLLICCLIIWDMTRYNLFIESYKTFKGFRTLLIMDFLTPIIVCILVFIRTLQQKMVSKKLSLITNIAFMICVISIIIIFYECVNLSYFLQIIDEYLFIVSYAVCAVVYDLYRVLFQKS